ncbi:HAMP domain-containing sensor histidine kinase [uncultured Parabacteroides sp.]|uniref:sensor histidine kinase n=1 Tax=uncultured Parabacteroides sp. TaxID=512312 RepID=UPI002617C864|nr:HAMP domain-containing sensor histidine kinase [uncultured Parabacteroides sp.]
MKITGPLNILFLLLMCCPAWSVQEKAAQDYILLLHSINFNESWTHEPCEKIRTLFPLEGIEVKGEELQIPAISDTAQICERIQYLREQYPTPPKAVVCIGDPAWLVVRPLFDKEWKDIPTLISYSRGMMPRNIKDMVDRKLDPKKAMMPTAAVTKGYKVTTLSQPLYVRETVETMLKIQPGLKKIVFISDNRYISIVTGQELQSVLKQAFPTLRLEMLTWPELSTENLLDRLTTYSNKDAGIIYYSWYATPQKEESHYLVDNVQKMTNSFSNPPVFLISDRGLKNGSFAGGHYISTEDFGDAIVSTLKEILKDKDALVGRELVGGTPKTYLNYQHLYAHGIDPSFYPKNAIYFDEPPTFLEKYKIAILCGIVILFLLASIAALRIRLLILKQKRKKELLEKEKIEESDRLKTAFLANMSHEIRTPLNAIVGFSNLIAQGECPEEDREEFCKIIETNNELLLQLINDILDLSKIEAGKLDFTYSDIDVSALFNHLMQVFSDKPQPGVELKCDLPDKPCFIHSEKNRLMQVLTNFLTNACKFTFKGSITMGYEEMDGGLRFYVTDTGKGIAEENLPHVFKRFAKFDAFIQGTGLGLSICQTIIECLKGEIGVESEEGAGSTFWFTIPCEVKKE